MRVFDLKKYGKLRCFLDSDVLYLHCGDILRIYDTNSKERAYIFKQVPPSVFVRSEQGENPFFTWADVRFIAFMSRRSKRISDITSVIYKIIYPVLTAPTDIGVMLADALRLDLNNKQVSFDIEVLTGYLFDLQEYHISGCLSLRQMFRLLKESCSIEAMGFTDVISTNELFNHWVYAVLIPDLKIFQNRLI